MLLAGLVAIAAAVLLVINIRQTRRSREYVQPDKATLHYSAVQIICGDCSGDGLMPLKTFMDQHGRCERCGGASYILASERGLFLRRSMVKHGLYVVANEPAEKPAVEPATADLETVPRIKIAV